MLTAILGDDDGFGDDVVLDKMTMFFDGDERQQEEHKTWQG